MASVVCMCDVIVSLFRLLVCIKHLAVLYYPAVCALPGSCITLALQQAAVGDRH